MFGIRAREIPQARRVLDQQLRFERFRQLPGSAGVFFVRGVRADDGLGAAPYDLGDTPILRLGNPSYLPVERVGQLDLSSDHA